MRNIWLFVKQYLPLWLSLLVALLIRVWLVAHSNGVVADDEVVFAIQAQHILHGEFPIYFYGQAYMGSLEAYLVALVFAVAGSSVWALRAEPILLSLLLVWLTWKLAAALAKAARLPGYAALVFQTVAAFLAAFPPLYDTVLELRAMGGYSETFVLMLLLLLLTFQLTHHWNAGASSRELVWRWAAIGFVVGLGLWVNPLIISAIAVAALWIAGFCLIQLIRLRQRAESSPHQVPGSFLKAWSLALVSIPATIAGCVPALYWGATHQWQNVTYILRLENMSSLSANMRSVYPTRFALFGGVSKFYVSCIAPRVIGGVLPSESVNLRAGVSTFALILSISCLLAVVTLVGCSFFLRHPLLEQVRQLTGLPLLFGASTALFFCTSIAAAYNLSCEGDYTGRYAVPLALAMPYFSAAIVTVLGMSLYRWKMQRMEQVGREQAIPNIPFSPTRSHRRAWPTLIAQTVLLAALLLYGYAQANIYLHIDPGMVFQSPFCFTAPADDTPIIAYLQREQIHYAWANNAIGFPILFKTQGSIILADPQPYIYNNPSLERFPQDFQLVLHADHPSFLVLVPRGDNYPLLLKLFDSEHVLYRVTYFPSQPGTEVLIVTPINRSVSPFASSAFYSIFRCNR